MGEDPGLSRRGGRRLAWGALFAVSSFFAFPHPLAGRVIDGGLVLAWIAPAALLLTVEGMRPRRAAGAAFLACLAADSAILHWIYVVTVRYGHAPPVVGVLAPMLLATYIAAFGAAFGAGAAWFGARGMASPVALALLWTVLDHLRSFALTGFPWATLGYAQHLNPALLGLAAWTGVYGLSFVTVLGSTGALACLFPRPGWGAGRRAGALALAATALLVAVGWLGAPPDPDGSAGSVRVAVLQGDIDQGVKWSPDWAERTMETYEDLTRRAVAQGAQVVVWPETAVPGSPDVDSELRARLEALARHSGVVLVVGAVGVDWLGPPGRSPYHVYDSAFVFDASGHLRSRYDKTHLVPFGEYLPLRGLIGRFVRAVATGSAGIDVTPGPAPRAVSLPLGRGTLTVGIPICYELLFPNLVRRFVDGGARVLLAITNDAWYGRTGAPYQFLAITALRSAETGTWTARAANTGVSALIDGRGRVRQRTKIFERSLLVGDVPLRTPGPAPTFYARHGDVFAWACWASLLGLGAWGWRRGREAGELGGGE